MFVDNRVRGERDSCTITAHILLPPDRLSIPCVVIDISEGGARLAVDPRTILPARFILAIPLIDDTYDERDVEVRWRKDDAVGVRFGHAC